MTLDAIGSLIGCTRERVRQIETKALAIVARKLALLIGEPVSRDRAIELVAIAYATGTVQAPAYQPFQCRRGCPRLAAVGKRYCVRCLETNRERKVRQQARVRAEMVH